MGQNIKNRFGIQGNGADCSFILNSNLFRGLACVLALTGNRDSFKFKLKNRGLVGNGVKQQDAVQAVDKFLVVNGHAENKLVFVLTENPFVVRKKYRN